MKRREILKAGVAAAAAATSGLVGAKAAAQQVANRDWPSGLEGLEAVGEAVLPASLGEDGRREALISFLGWIRDHQAGRELEHGYGHTRVATSKPAPVEKYAAQLQALDEGAKRIHGRAFAALEVDARRKLIVDAFRVSKIEALPGELEGAHVAADLMSHYFGSSEANDLCYEAGIGRDSCRSLNGSEERPEPLARGLTR